MKWQKKGLVATMLVSVALLSVACGDKTAASDKDGTTPTEYDYIYGTDPDTFDYTFTSRATNGDHAENFVEGLLTYDKYGELSPGMAKSWDVSDDGLTYTYHLRTDAKWVDSEENVYAKVTAQDFVTGLKHAVAAKSETLYVVQDSIEGLADYVSGKTNDFSTVGIKAVDDHTVEYTLNQPESYWNSKLHYGVLFPVNAEFLAAQGENFGRAKADGILYNGPYILSSYASKSVISYKANPEYWDKKDVHIKKVKLIYNDGTNPDQLYKSFVKGDYTYARVYPTSADYKNVLANSKNNIVWSPQNSASYNFTFNINRKSYNATSKTTDKQKSDTRAALLNRDFRWAVQAAFDKTAYNAQSTGDDAAARSLRNEFTPPNFVSIDGEDYSKTVEKYLADYDKTAFGEMDLSDGQDGTYDVSEAKEFLAAAKETLQASGVSFPIHIDIPVNQKVVLGLNRAKSFKSSVEKSLGADNVKIDIQLLPEDKYLTATYSATTGAASDFDVSNASGWSPDFDDPSTYLSIYSPVTGTSVIGLGLDPSATLSGADPGAAAKKAVGMDQFEKLLNTAEATTKDINQRYKAFAKAEAWLIDSGLQMTTNSAGGVPSVTKVVPFTGQYSTSGAATSYYKGMKLQRKAVTTTQYKKAQQTWEKKLKEIAEDKE